MRKILRSRRVLVDGALVPADILIEESRIYKIQEYHQYAEGLDFGDRIIAPGMVDLHSDSLEKEVEPRPGASFPIEVALSELDKKLSLSGITTIFHALGFLESIHKKMRSPENGDRMVRLIKSVNEQHLLVDNRVHIRFEKSAVEALPLIEALIADGLVDMVSFMDHTPGQGQWKNIDKWKIYVSRDSASRMSEEDIQAYIQMKNEKKNEGAVRGFSERLREKGIIMLSHDDDGKEDIDRHASYGVSIAEFPLSVETAVYARKAGLASCMGSPNVVRGGSQSGNVSALDLIRNNVCDFLCSDYHPASMLLSVYKLVNENIMDFGKAYQMVSSTPAKLSGLTDRGIIEAGMLADLIVIDESFVPRVVYTMKSGQCVYQGMRR